MSQEGTKMSQEKSGSYLKSNLNLLLVSLFLASAPSFALAAPPGNDFENALNRMGTKIECEQMDFNQKEVEKCMEIYQTCMTPDRRPSERKQCIIDYVRNVKIPEGWEKEQKLQIERRANEERKKEELRRIKEQQQMAQQREQEKLFAEQQREKEKLLAIKQKRHDSIIDNGNGTITDTKTGLMWANKEYENSNGNTSWRDAKNYCRNFRGGGYTDWRMPTVEELASLDFNVSGTAEPRCEVTKIHLTGFWVWASGSTKDGNSADYFDFWLGKGRSMSSSDGGVQARALPVRDANKEGGNKSQPPESTRNTGSTKIGLPSVGIRPLDIEMRERGEGTLQVTLKQYEITKNNEIVITIELTNFSNADNKPRFAYCDSEVCSEYLPYIKDDKGQIFKAKRPLEIVSHDGTFQAVEQAYPQYMYLNKHDSKYKFLYGLKFLRLNKLGKSVVKFVFPIVSDGATKFTFTWPEIREPGSVFNIRSFAFPSNDVVL